MSNRLVDETSPYLLQHAHNPVDWWPWGDEALAEASATDRPILLSIGYSACHWCHVMERESFEDDDTAAVMNALFVNIKVDREERPDVDELYMKAVQAFQRGAGGWPMTVFCTPDGKPFFGGTYYPPTSRHGMPSFRDVMHHMARTWTERRGEAERIGEQLTDFLIQHSVLPPPAVVTDGWLAPLARSATRDYDATRGGFGGAPKFPPHGLLQALLAHHHRTKDASTLEMVVTTLDGMARGGLYDLLGGGFARYSVDPDWRVPHFEKMLYDNAQLVPVYTDAWKVTRDPHYARIVRETLTWCDREMTLPHGGFAASLDADSEGVEGKYFAWTPAQLRELLGEDGDRVAAMLQVTGAGTFEHGTSVLRLDVPPERRTADERACLENALPKLFEARSRRIAPDRDDKVITAWTALMISAYARAAAAFDEPEWAATAGRAARFLLDEVTVDGRLMRTYKDGRARLPGYADDHGALVNALVDLWEATFDPAWLDAAVALADQLVALFWDDEAGGLFYTGRDTPPLIARSKNPIGGAEPSANGLAALAFTRLAALVDREDLGARADIILSHYATYLEHAPRALGVEALAGAWRATGGRELGIVGDVDEAAPLLAVARAHYQPFTVVALSPGCDSPIPWMADRPSAAGPTAYLCEGRVCRAPTSSPEALDLQLRGT